jgi:hypothetical protein
MTRKKADPWKSGITRFVVLDRDDFPYKMVLLRSLIVDGRRENGGNPNIAEKYRWLGWELNAFIAAKRLGEQVAPLSLG